MAKKEEVKITPEGIKLLTVMCYSGYTDGFYGKEVYFTDGFEGNTQYLYQALGNIGAYARNRDIDSDISYVIIGNKIVKNPDSDLYNSFVTEFESLLNQNNSPYRKMYFITEDQLIWKIESRASNTSDDDLKMFIKKYKDSIKNYQTNLF
ncbi:hypothetical protein [Proteiniphilum sp.]|uniref:hypothetical protein n=1 Tax=Proteiniphilum sp. TaxID=1926877 RepID=UPI002B2146A2|nr:hypothetical protein [Proteiniphilum sp.]MEA4918157.1 hypothetical protein [Proteiniphilum sp.]